ncbi:MAG: hypothetical protein JXM73_20450, partial [Anaerolineae bacterium]|nr:hypothetical protein [Anaerolineae bacterium]
HLIPKRRNWLPPLAWSGLAALILFQAWAYYYRLPLSLGPRMILQPWLLQNGLVSYENIGDQHMMLLPLLFVPLRLLIPDGLQLAKLVLVALISLSTLLTFLAGRRTAGWLGGLLAALFFAAWSPAFTFGKLWHETFLAPLYLLLLILYDPSAPRRSTTRLLCLGLIGGGTMVTKQHAAVVFAAFLLWNALTGWYLHRSKGEILREAGLMILGASLPFLAFFAYQYARAGTLQSFWYWVVIYNLTSDYGILAARSPTTAQIRIILASLLLIPATIVYTLDQKKKGNKIWLSLSWGLVLLATSSLTVYPRFELFHLQAALPVLAWLSAVPLTLALPPRKHGRFLAAGIIATLLAVWLFIAAPAYRAVLKTNHSQKIWEYSNLVPLAAEIRQQIGPDDCMYIFPDDEATANLYYLTGCMPRFWVFSYPWYMVDTIKQQILAALEEDPPQWVVAFPGRWEIEKHAPEVMGYLEDHYRLEAELHWAQGEAWLLKRLP